MSTTIHPQTAPTSTESEDPPTPTRPSPRFEIELEFVSALANPIYLQYLAVTFPNLFTDTDNPRETTATTTTRLADSIVGLQKEDHSISDAACFSRYLAYLLSYWRTPAYIQYLTHPAATIRNLELLQIPQFRKDIVRPDVLTRLAEGFAGVGEYPPPGAEGSGTGIETGAGLVLAGAPRTADGDGDGDGDVETALNGVA